QDLPGEMVLIFEPDDLPDFAGLSFMKGTESNVQGVGVFRLDEVFRHAAVKRETDDEQAFLLGMPGHDGIVALVFALVGLHKRFSLEDFVAEAPFVDVATLQLFTITPLAIDCPLTGETLQGRQVVSLGICFVIGADGSGRKCRSKNQYRKYQVSEKSHHRNAP